MNIDSRRIVNLKSETRLLFGQRTSVRWNSPGPDDEFMIERIILSNAHTKFGAADWVINDILIDGKSQLEFVVEGEVHPRGWKELPGALFSAGGGRSIMVLLGGLDVVRAKMDLTLVVTYVGTNEDGCPFYGSAIGVAPPARASS